MDVKFSDLYMNCLADNIIKELSDDVKVNVQSGVDEAGPSKKVAEVQRDIDLYDSDVDPDVENALTPPITLEQADQIRRFRERLNVAAVETDEEESLPESLPS